MQKIKIKTVHVKTSEVETRLEYYLVLKGGLCGIEIRDAHSKESAVRFTPDVAEKAYKFLLKLARGRLFPVHLNDVADDYIYEKWSCEGGLQLLCTSADARLDRGERQGENFGDLRAGVAANEG